MDPASDSLSDSAANREVTLFDLWLVIWDGKYLIIVLTGFFTLIAVVYALLATEWYRADALLVPADDQSMSDLGGQLGGLAALAGIRPGVGTRNSSEALSVLRSREFARNFIVKFELLSLFLEDADNSEAQSDMLEAIEFFHDNILRVHEDRDTGQVTLGTTWTDPDTAAQWANALVERLNGRMRERALRDAQANIDFLRSEMATNNVVAIEQSISRIMETEMQKLMLARGSKEYAFRVIDPAVPPRVRSQPRRSLLVVSVFVVSGMLSLLVAFIRNAVRRNSTTHSPANG